MYEVLKQKVNNFIDSLIGTEIQIYFDSTLKQYFLYSSTFNKGESTETATIIKCGWGGTYDCEKYIDIKCQTSDGKIHSVYFLL